MSLPEAMPSVTYDIAVGEYAEWTDFDYEAYCDMATAAGLTDQQIDKLSIRFVAESGATPIKDALRREPGHKYMLGNYIPFVKRAHINVNAAHEIHTREALFNPDLEVRSVETTLNRAVVHETGHHIDWHLGAYKYHLAAHVARWALLGSINKLNARKHGAPMLSDLVAALEQQVHTYDQEESPLEKPAYAFDAENCGQYQIVTYEPAARFEVAKFQEV